MLNHDKEVAPMEALISGKMGFYCNFGISDNLLTIQISNCPLFFFKNCFSLNFSIIYENSLSIQIFFKYALLKGYSKYQGKMKVLNR